MADLLGLLTSKMDYLTQRQMLLQENVSHADIANYKAKDLAPFTFNQALNQASFTMEATNSKHIIPVSMTGTNAKAVKVKTNETTLNGNSVELEEQMAKVSETGVEFQYASSMYHKIMGLIRIAVRGQ